MTANGNEEVVATLERLLLLAKQGRAGYLTAMMLTDGQPPVGGWFGSPTLIPASIAAHRQMLGMMEAALVNRTLPPRAADVPADRVCYNVPESPISYDFICWLVDAEMTRRIEGAPAPLKVCFWLGRDGNTGLQWPSRRRMLDNVLRPALALIGAVENETAADGRYKPFFSARDIVAAARAGHEVPMLRAPVALFNDDSVTITLREAEHYPERNSNIDAWARFAYNLQDMGKRVIFVRDTAKANEPMYGFETCPRASLDLRWRMALYESAKMNLFVSNGPGSLGYFSTFPWMMFNPICPDGGDYEPATPGFWRSQFGIEAGSQLPWSRPDQRIIWAKDDYENLIAAWDGAMVRCPEPA